MEQTFNFSLDQVVSTAMVSICNGKVKETVCFHDTPANYSDLQVALMVFFHGSLRISLWRIKLK